MFRTFLLSRMGQNIGRKGILSPFIIHRPGGTKYFDRRRLKRYLLRTLRHANRWFKYVFLPI